MSSLTETLEATTGQPDEVLEQLTAEETEIAEAEREVQASGMGEKEKEDLVRSLMQGERTSQNAIEIAHLYPPKSAKTGKRFRQV